MITTLTGSNSFGLRLKRNQMVTDFTEEHGDMGLEKLDGEEVEFNKIRESLESLPFLASKKMVVLDAPSSNKEFIEKAENLLKNIPETTDVIIVESKLDKRSSYYKFLNKNTDFKEFDEMDGPALSRWLVEQAKSEDGSMSLADAKHLIERVGTDQGLLDNELKKLLDYDKDITSKTIDLLTEPTPQSTIFELLDAAFAGNIKRALEIYEEQRALKVEPIQIIAMLAWQLHVLAVIKTADSRTPSEIAKEAKINPFVVNKSQNIARRLSLSELKKLISDVLELDVRMKRESINADDALRSLFIQIAHKK